MSEVFSSPYLFAAEAEAAPVGFLGTAIYIAIVLVIIFAALAKAKGGLKQRVFRDYLTSRTEQLYLFIEQMCVSVIGAHGRKYVPMMITFWLVIFVGNLVALFAPFSPTASLSFNLALALTSIGYVQWEGMKANGVFGHFSHFAGPKLGGIMALLISPVIFCIEIVSELMKNVSLSLRLYGNIHGGHEAVEKMNALGVHIANQKWLNIPVGEFLLPIKLLTVVVQAMIFTLLTCVYLSLVTAHGHDDHSEDHSEQEAHGVAVPA